MKSTFIRPWKKYQWIS